MAEWRYHIGNKFGACKLIAKARDEHRGRDVRLYHVPGEFDYVGVNDGIDCWICPVIADPFSAAVGRQLTRIREGKEIIPVDESARVRRRVAPGTQMQLALPPPSPPPRERKRAVLAQPEPQSRGRHVVRR